MPGYQNTEDIKYYRNWTFCWYIASCL